jgi:hypothetical protein
MTIQPTSTTVAQGVSDIAHSGCSKRPDVSDSNSSLLGELSFSGDPLFELQALMAEMNLQDKQTAREARRIEESAVDDAVSRSIKAMEEQANAQWWSGVYSGLGQAAAGAGSALGGAASGGGGLLSNQNPAAWARLGGAVGQGTGTVLASKEQADATYAQAKAERAAADQDIAKRKIEDATEAASQAQDALRSTLERLEEILMAEEKTKQSAIRA